jgi:hypothetical protein
VKNHFFQDGRDGKITNTEEIPDSGEMQTVEGYSTPDKNL